MQPASAYVAKMATMAGLNSLDDEARRLTTLAGLDTSSWSAAKALDVPGLGLSAEAQIAKILRNLGTDATSYQADFAKAFEELKENLLLSSSSTFEALARLSKNYKP